MQGDPPHHYVPRMERKASTSSLPALRRKISSGSHKAMKWVGKHLKPSKTGSDGSSDLWGTSREARPDASPPSSYASSVWPGDFPDEWPMPRMPPNQRIPVPTPDHRMERPNLERHERHPAYEWQRQNPLSLRGQFLSAEKETERPLTAAPRARYTEAMPLGSGSRSFPSRSSSQPPPGNRLRSDHQSMIDTLLPLPGPPPSSPLPIPPSQFHLHRQGEIHRPDSRRQRSPPGPSSSLNPPRRPLPECSAEYIPLVHQPSPGSSNSRRASRLLPDFPTKHIPIAHQSPPDSSSSYRVPHRPLPELPTDYIPLAHPSPAASSSSHRAPRQPLPVLPSEYPLRRTRRKDN